MKEERASEHLGLITKTKEGTNWWRIKKMEEMRGKVREASARNEERQEWLKLPDTWAKDERERIGFAFFVCVCLSAYLSIFFLSFFICFPIVMTVYRSVFSVCLSVSPNISIYPSDRFWLTTHNLWATISSITTISLVRSMHLRPSIHQSIHQSIRPSV